MANRKEYRKLYKRERNKYVSQDEVEIKSFLIIIVIIIIVLALIYFLTVLAKDKGFFDSKYTKPELNPANISYSNITYGTVFDREESSYYVLVVDTQSDDQIYLSSLISSYEEKEDSLSVYIVDLNEGFNKKIKGEKDNEDAQNSNELSVSNYALIKITDKENVKYLTNIEDIEEELK